MRDYKLRTDLKRAVIGSFALPLGIEPVDLPAPTQGYTLTWHDGEDGEPDGWSFHVVASHDRMAGLVREAFGLLPDEVTPIVEVGSRDAYRSQDVYLGHQPLPFETFLETWESFEPVILEDASIGVGANAEEPFVEVFLDSWKGLLIHVPEDMKSQVERMLRRHSLREVEQTWPEDLEEQGVPSQVREVLQIEDGESPDLDEVLLQMRERWDLELDVDPNGNVDEAGRELGLTLWYGIAVCRDADFTSRAGAYVTIWATAGSVADLERLLVKQLEQEGRWVYERFHTLDRVAFDERPDELTDLPLRGRLPAVHLMSEDPW
ncbi:MAG: hypothetical protein RLZZ558_1607 [Planctomycetota bacterium]